MWRRLSQFYPPWVELILLALLGFSFWYPATHYTEMPMRIPTHFGSAGLPDGWATKSWGTVLLGAAIMTGVYLLVTGMGLWMAIVEDPKKLINWPGEQALKMMSTERAELLRRVTLQGLLATKALIVGMGAYLEYASTQVAIGRSKSIGWWIWVFVGGILVVSGYLVWKTVRLTYPQEKRPGVGAHRK